MKKNLYLLLLAFIVQSLPLHAGYSDAELLDRVVRTIQKEGEAIRTRNPPVKAENVFREEMKDLSDSEKTSALALWLFSKGDWYSGRATDIARIILHDPEFIKDSEPLREMIAAENDPRRFYLISGLTWPFERKGGDFIPQRIHMLFRTGPVAKSVGEDHQEFFDDVGIYTYDSIIGNLKDLHANFIRPDKERPFPERRLILARWLKANWPGCENLEIPAGSAKPKDGSRPEVRPDISAAKASNETNTEAATDQQAPSSNWPWIIGILAISAAVPVFLKLRRS